MPGMWCLQDHGEEAEVKSQRDGEGWNLKNKILKKVCVCVHSIMKSYSPTWFSPIPWTVACQASLSMGFSRQEYWFGLSFSSPTEEGQFSSVTQSYPTLYDPMDCSTPGFPVHHQLPELAQTHVHWVSDATSNHLILCLPLLLSPSIFPSIRVFSSESVLCIRWPKLLEFQFQLQSFQWTPRTDLL